MESFRIMRPLCLFLLVGVSASAQPFSVGLKAGVPLTDFFNTVQNVSTTVPNRYIIGAEAELRLPFGLGVEVDALYRRLNYTDQIISAATAGTISATAVTTD